MKANAFRAAKNAIAQQLNSIKGLTVDQMESICRDRLVVPEMKTRVGLSGKKKLLNPSNIERELDSVLAEVAEIMGDLQYLQRCRRWATTNRGATYSAFCRVMSCEMKQPRLKSMCEEFGMDGSWVDSLVPRLHDSSAAFGFMDDDDELSFASDSDSDPSGIVPRRPNLDQLAGEKEF